MFIGLWMHQMVSIGNDLIIIGGKSGSTITGNMYKLSCSNNDCQMDILPQKLKTPRYDFTAIVVPDDFVEC